MDNIDSSESNAKVSDSAYSNSCSNSHSRRSRSSKSTHSESNSSGSSGYGGKPNRSSSNDENQSSSETSIRKKESKKKKCSLLEPTLVESQAEEEAATADTAAEPPQAPEKTGEVIVRLEGRVVRDDGQLNAPASPQPAPAHSEHVADEKMDIAPPESSVGKEALQVLSLHLEASSQSCIPVSSDGFWCVISMHDGVVMYTTGSVTTALGYPRKMWIGRSFIDFIHPRDRSTFASQITSGLATPKHVKGEEKPPGEDKSKMFCRVRRYRGLGASFAVKEKLVIFTPFLLKLSFKNLSDDNGETTYLVVQALPFLSFFKVPNEKVTDAAPFVLRHSALGIMEYVSPESVPFLGYLPQELTNKDAIQLYHPEDLPYLNTVYQTIVREGGAPRTNPYRMMSQNGQYIKLETEWTSFINPWSKKLEFVTGKHYTIEGPPNPDVFQTPELEKQPKWSDEDKKKTQELRISIVNIINEILTKPAEVAKQQMSRRCQDLATFMETLMAEQIKTDAELGLEILEPDQTCHDLDSEMLGGISPHHDYNDGESSTETPLSYNQLNYNETLDRYFERYQGRAIEEFQLSNSDSASTSDSRMSLRFPMLTSGDSGDTTSSSDSTPLPKNSTTALRLTETLITKHNHEMEKELVMKHREPRFTSRGERDKIMKENRQKKIEHLARCNAVYQPTAASAPVVEPEPAPSQPHGVKRISGFDGSPVRQKHHCPAARHHHSPHQHPPHCTPFIDPANVWGGHYPVGMPSYVQDSQMAQPMSIIGSMTPMPGMIPMYYMPPPSGMNMTQPQQAPNHYHPQPHPVQYMMVPQPVFGTPFMYSPMTTQVTFPVPQTLVQQSTVHLINKNFGTANNALPAPSVGVASIEAVPEVKDKEKLIACGEESAERTDDSTNSSFYSSSFFKTDSGSAEESSDNKKTAASPVRARPPGGYEPYQFKKIQRRNKEPPWMEKVCMSSDLIYKYQLLSKNPDEVLHDDRRKILTLEQPALVNEQLGQLYIDLQLEGVAARLSLEEGLTSSGSSGEETNNQSKLTTAKKTRRKREYSKLAMIYEEDAPFPSSPENCQSS